MFEEGKCGACAQPVSETNKRLCEKHRLMANKRKMDYYLKKKGLYEK